MITRLCVKGFRALKDFALEVPPGVPVVLIGSNGTGKTTILEVFDFLHELATEGTQRAFQRRGGFDAIATRGGDGRIEITVEYSLTTAENSIPARYRLAFASIARGGWRLERDELDALDEGAWVEIARNNPDRKVSREEIRGVLTPLQIAGDETLLSSHRGRGPLTLSDMLLLPLAHLRYVPSFEVRATWARRPGDTVSRSSVVTVDHVTELDAHGLNLLNVLHTLSSDIERRSAWERLLDEFRREFPYVNEVSFPPSGGGRGQVVMKWRDGRSGQWMFFDEMSDGMIVYLTLLTTLLTPVGGLGRLRRARPAHAPLAARAGRREHRRLRRGAHRPRRDALRPPARLPLRPGELDPRGGARRRRGRDRATARPRLSRRVDVAVPRLGAPSDGAPRRAARGARVSDTVRDLADAIGDDHDEVLARVPGLVDLVAWLSDPRPP
ncbi:MAG: AAA family ATPase [Polyangiales bacterium]